jgi:hypothetical protein
MRECLTARRHLLDHGSGLTSIFPNCADAAAVDRWQSMLSAKRASADRRLAKKRAD